MHMLGGKVARRDTGPNGGRDGRRADGRKMMVGLGVAGGPTTSRTPPRIIRGDAVR